MLFGMEDWALGIILAVIFCLNYYFLAVREVGTSYEREFLLLGKRERIWRLVVAGTTIALIIGVLFFSLYATQPPARL